MSNLRVPGSSIRNSPDITFSMQISIDAASKLQIVTRRGYFHNNCSRLSPESFPDQKKGSTYASDQLKRSQSCLPRISHRDDRSMVKVLSFDRSTNHKLIESLPSMDNLSHCSSPSPSGRLSTDPFSWSVESDFFSGLPEFKSRSDSPSVVLSDENFPLGQKISEILRNAEKVSSSLTWEFVDDCLQFNSFITVELVDSLIRLSVKSTSGACVSKLHLKDLDTLAASEGFEDLSGEIVEGVLGKSPNGPFTLCRSMDLNDSFDKILDNTYQKFNKFRDALLLYYIFTPEQSSTLMDQLYLKIKESVKDLNDTECLSKLKFWVDTNPSFFCSSTKKSRS